MLKIRLFRVGKRNQPTFKIVVTDRRNAPRAGRFREELGFYNPLTKQRSLHKERVQYWLSKGSQPSETVYNLLLAEKIIEGKKIPLHKKRKGDQAEKTKEDGVGQQAQAIDNSSKESKIVKE
jgi:small subunit ribosomal protein S16